MKGKSKKRLNGFLLNLTLLVICFLWTIPTIGLLLSSLRSREDIATSGWWYVFPHKEWVTKDTIELDRESTDLKKPIETPLGTFTDEQLSSGVIVNNQQLIWENRRARTISVQEKEWFFIPNLTLQNYQNVLTGKQYTYIQPDGSTRVEQGDDLSGALLNSLSVSIPSTVIPILIAAFAAYGFAWINFPGRRMMFTAVVALLVVPLQLALIPILRDYVNLNLNGTFLAVWLAHTGFGLPLATYLLYNYISTIPRDILESAFIDGASHFTVFTRLVLPLSVPALASFAIFQFLWVWNDYLVALVFIGSKADVQVLTMRLAEMVGSRGQDWHFLTAGAFVTMIIPLIVFFSLQRYFVRGLMAGSVKG